MSSAMSRKLLKGIDTAGLQLRLIDAKEQVVGRLASRIAVLLQGKDKPDYVPYLDKGDIVVVKNARHVEFTGKKWDQKLYRHHTGFPGGLKERTARDQFRLQPDEILRRAVYGMLPKNKLRKERARKLRIFLDEKHPFEGHPDLTEWAPYQRNLRNKEVPEDLKPGEVLLNPEGYFKSFKHVLSEHQKELVLRQIKDHQGGVERLQASRVIRQNVEKQA